MKKNSQLWIGVILLVLGVLYLAAILLEIDLRGSFWALILIAIGVWLLVRPAYGEPGDGGFRFIGEVRRSGQWQVQDMDLRAFIGDVRLDLSEAIIPEGETVLSFQGFVSDVKMTAPWDVGIAIEANGFVSDLRLFKDKQDNFLSPGSLRSDGYESATRKIRIEMSGFINEIKVRED